MGVSSQTPGDVDCKSGRQGQARHACPCASALLRPTSGYLLPTIKRPNLSWLHFALQTVALELITEHNCYPVFLGSELKQKYYKGQLIQLVRTSGEGALLNMAAVISRPPPPPSDPPL